MGKGRQLDREEARKEIKVNESIQLNERSSEIERVL